MDFHTRLVYTESSRPRERQSEALSQKPNKKGGWSAGTVKGWLTNGACVIRAKEKKEAGEGRE